MLKLIRRLIPTSIKGRLRQWSRNVALRRALKELARVQPGCQPSEAIIEGLVYGWGNASWSANVELIRGMLAGVWESNGPVLECGSGLSTLVLGIAARQTGRRVWSLEHESGWAAKVRETLRQFQIDNVEVCAARLRSFGDYSWYDVPPDQLPNNIGFVVCDGPPGDTPGGRFGLLPRMQSQLAPGCLVLLDDAGRPGELEVLERWSELFGCDYTVLGEDKPFARLTIPGNMDMKSVHVSPCECSL
jgi:predicted O-methyltransferase YrrM